MQIKDQMLWSALQEKKVMEEELEAEKKLSSEYANEVAEWAVMSQACAQVLTCATKNRCSQPISYVIFKNFDKGTTQLQK